MRVRGLLVVMFVMLVVGMTAGAAGVYASGRFTTVEHRTAPDPGIIYSTPGDIVTYERVSVGAWQDDAAQYWFYLAGCAIVSAVAFAFTAHISVRARAT